MPSLIFPAGLRSLFSSLGATARFVAALCGLVLVLSGQRAVADNGEDLARTWCSGCHAFPAPHLLNRTTWLDRVLPEMGARLGMAALSGGGYRANPNAPEGVYADEPLLETEDWEAIVAWYEAQSPEHLASAEWVPREELDLFEIETTEHAYGDFAGATAILIDEVAGRLVVADSTNLSLDYFDAMLEPVGAVRTGGVVSRIRRLADADYLLTIMGGTAGQAELPEGLLIRLSGEEEGGLPVRTERLALGLHRPVDAVARDFDGDGLTDYATAGFGTYFGELALHFGQRDGTLRKEVVTEDAGAISLGVDGDNLIVLMAQGDERILSVDGRDSRTPTFTTIQRMPPSYGSNGMVLSDLDGDGLHDLLVTAGDNADISPIYKPYHGLYIHRQEADGSFVPDRFYPFDGAGAVVAADFDNDGDNDIAAVAYYPNLGRGLDEATLVILRNDGEAFSPHHVVGLGRLGRFAAMSAGDLDGDGDVDVALANLAFGPYGPMNVPEDLQEAWLKGPRFVLLRNRLK